MRRADDIRKRIDDLIVRCRTARMSVTSQRLAIFGAVLRSAAHPSCEDVFREVRPLHPALSLATVYKTLDVLKRLGVIRELPVSSGARRFDGNLERHHHLVCTQCDRIVDLHDETLDGIQAPLLGDRFQPTEVTVVILGRCGRCSPPGL